MQNLIFHVDLDAFFASVEQLENRSLVGKPVIVAGLGSRGVVSAASYEAREFGVHSAQPTSLARQKCPHGVYITPRISTYSGYSLKVMGCLAEFSPVVEQISIDEAFLDMTGCEGLSGPPMEAGKQLKEFIYRTIGLKVSVGMAQNKFLAKLASDMSKPDGLMLVERGREREFLDPLPVGSLWGVGKKSVAALHQLGIYSVKQLRSFPSEELDIHFGKAMSSHLMQLSRGEDHRELTPEHREKSISNEMTFESDCPLGEKLQKALVDLSDRVARRARKEGLAGRTVTLIWRDPDFSRHNRGHSLSTPTNDSQTILNLARRSLREITSGTLGLKRHRFRLIGVRLSNFDEGNRQLSLFESVTPKYLDKAMDAVRDKFGESSIFRARQTGNQFEEKE